MSNDINLYEKNEKLGVKTYNYVKRLKYLELKEEAEGSYDFLYVDRKCKRWSLCCEMIWCHPIKFWRMFNSCFNLGEVIIIIGIALLIISVVFNFKYVKKIKGKELNDNVCVTNPDIQESDKSDICNKTYNGSLCIFSFVKFKEDYGGDKISDDSLRDMVLQSLGTVLIIIGLIISYRKNLTSFLLKLLMDYGNTFKLIKNVGINNQEDPAKNNPFIKDNDIKIDLTNQNAVDENKESDSNDSENVPSSNSYYSKETKKIDEEIQSLKQKIQSVNEEIDGLDEKTQKEIEELNGLKEKIQTEINGLEIKIKKVKKALILIKHELINEGSGSN